ncbi:MAG: hypothetical protein ACQETL_10240 [Bacteroidota bacterium]
MHYPGKRSYGMPKSHANMIMPNQIDDSGKFTRSAMSFMRPDTVKNREFNWDLLIYLKRQVGEKRFDSQYFKVNLDLKELYVLSEANNSKYRIKTDESGFSKMYVTGTWIQNGFNVGCVEARVMAGMQTARAINRQFFDEKNHKRNRFSRKLNLSLVF